MDWTKQSKSEFGAQSYGSQSWGRSPYGGRSESSGWSESSEATTLWTYEVKVTDETWTKEEKAG